MSADQRDAAMDERRYREEVRELLQRRLHGLLTSAAMFKAMEQSRAANLVPVSDAQRIVTEIVREPAK